MVAPSAAPLAPFSLDYLFAGFGFIRRNPVLLGAISLDMFAVLLGGATALLPIYARDILHTGPEGLGLLRCAPALGAIVTAVWLARRPLQSRVGGRMLGAVACFGIAMLVFAVSTSLVLSVLALAVTGASDMVSVVIRQRRTPGTACAAARISLPTTSWPSSRRWNDSASSSAART